MLGSVIAVLHRCTVTDAVLHGCICSDAVVHCSTNLVSFRIDTSLAKTQSARARHGKTTPWTARFFAGRLVADL